MPRRSITAPLIILACLSQFAVGCGTHPYYFGYARVGGKVAVYAPLCSDEQVRSFTVTHFSKEKVETLWNVTDPTSDASQNGFTVLGRRAHQYRIQLQDPPETFPAKLDISVKTSSGSRYSAVETPPADLPRYATGTPYPGMTFWTKHGRRRPADFVRAFRRAKC